MGITLIIELEEFDS